MAKKSQVPPAPEMTALPISGGDSPLVIDLPDGQKLVVGSLPAGSVIEVATWRGTGRPDSRTSRLMLGMSSSAATPAESSSTESSSAESKQKPTSLVQKALAVLKAILSKVASLVASRKKTTEKKKSSAPFIETVTPAPKSNEAAEVDDWLNSILEKSAKKQALVVKSEEKSAAKPAVKKTVAQRSVAKKSATKKATAGRK